MQEYIEKGDELKFHTDRNSCKVSVTLNLGGDLWPFYLIKNKIKIKAMLKPGDGLLYKGCELINGREKFKGTECLQVFLHYLTNKKYKYRTYVS